MAFTTVATGGLAYGGVKYEINDHVNPTTASKTQTGWTIGGGIEKAVTDDCSVKLEYLYVDLGTSNFSPADLATPPRSFATDIHTRSHEIRLGLNLHF